jgi:hypothetical protein
MSHRVLVFTFKEGLLARMAHDLRLHVEKFTISRESNEVIAKFDPGSLVVDGVMHDGGLVRDELGERDRNKIQDNIRGEVLHTQKHPRIEFRGHIELPQLRVVGELSLAGVRRPLTIMATRDRDRVRATVNLRPSDFGIEPFKALGGAIRLQDRVKVELDLDAKLLGLGADG